jgi:hypothetical protein
MYEIDFLPVGDGEKSGDAVALRYTNPETGRPIVGIIDAGFATSGPALVEHIKAYYDTRDVAFAICTHIDGDHAGGMEVVLEELNVEHFLIHRPAAHGYPNVANAERAEKLWALAEDLKIDTREPFQGIHGWGQSLVVAGPTEGFYRETLDEQEGRTLEADALVASRVLKLAEEKITLTTFPAEQDFDDAGGDRSPCNNGAAIVSLIIEGRHLVFPSDSGVSGLTAAFDYLDDQERTKEWPKLFALPHHGGRHNIDLATLHRILGAHTSMQFGTAVASVSKRSPNPSPRVANAAGRRGYPVIETRGSTLWHHSSDAPARGWAKAVPLPPLEETDHDN